MGITVYKPELAADRQIRGVLFDMDGLVVDTEKLFTRFWMEAARSYGFPMTLEQALGMRSLNRDNGAAKLQSYFGPTADYRAIRARRIELMDAYIAREGVTLKPGIRELLNAMEDRGIPGAITSSSPRERIVEYLGRYGLAERFRALCSGYQLPHGKPAPDIYLYGAEALGVDPKSCLALEDSPTGILSAHRAGCLPVMIPDLDQPDADTIPLLYAQADSLSDVISLL